MVDLILHYFTPCIVFKQQSKWADMSYGPYVIMTLLQTSKLHIEVFQAWVAK